jgi:hypothetical protein
LKSKINNTKPTFRPQSANIVPGNLAVTTRAFVFRLTPPEHLSFAFQNIALRGLSIFESVPFGIGRTDMANDGRADKTAVVRVRRPPIGRKDVRQPGMRLEILMERNSRAAAESLWSESGNPRYVWGKDEMGQPRMLARSEASSIETPPTGTKVLSTQIKTLKPYSLMISLKHLSTLCLVLGLVEYLLLGCS